MADGKGCKCLAYGPSECACDADWTPQKFYDLRAALQDARHFILNRHNMGAQKREKQRLYVLRSISTVLNDSTDEKS